MQAHLPRLAGRGASACPFPRHLALQGLTGQGRDFQPSFLSVRRPRKSVHTQQSQQLIPDSLPSPDPVLPNSPPWQRPSASAPRTPQPHGHRSPTDTSAPRTPQPHRHLSPTDSAAPRTSRGPAGGERLLTPHPAAHICSLLFTSTRTALCASGAGAAGETPDLSCGRCCSADPAPAPAAGGAPPGPRDGPPAPGPASPRSPPIPAGGSGRSCAGAMPGRSSTPGPCPGGGPGTGASLRSRRGGRSAPAGPGRRGLPRTHLPCARPTRRSSCSA